MPTDYGSDLSCLADLIPSMAETSGQRMLAEAYVRRLSTPRGQLYRYPNYGYDLRGLIKRESLIPGDVERDIEAELLKDERTKSVAADVTFAKASEELSIDIVVDSDEGPFELVLGIDSVSVQILELSERRVRSDRRIR